MVPNVEENSHSQPPVGSLCIAQVYQYTKNKAELRNAYPALLKWNTWYYENRSTSEGFLCWGDIDPASGKGTLFGAKCESGMDNAPAFDDAVRDPVTGLLMQADVGLTGLFIRDCDVLMQMAAELGRPEDIAVLRARKERAKQGLAMLWNEDDGIFENKDLQTGQWVRRLSPMNFFALYSDDVTVVQKRRVVEEHLLDPDEFWGEWVLPSISRRDYAFEEQHYWRGRIWAPLNFLVYDALKCAGLTVEAKMLAEKSEHLLLKEWREHRHVHENYSAVDGTGCSARQSDAFYHWGALLGYMALDAQDIGQERPEE
jgi:glycogen debranching enzyme